MTAAAVTSLVPYRPPPENPRLGPEAENGRVIYPPCARPPMEQDSKQQPASKRLYYRYTEETAAGNGFVRLHLGSPDNRSALARLTGKKMMAALRKGSRVFVGSGEDKVEIFIDGDDKDAQNADGSRPQYLESVLVAVPAAGGRRAERPLPKVRNPNYLPPREATAA